MQCEIECVSVCVQWEKLHPLSSSLTLSCSGALSGVPGQADECSQQPVSPFGGVTCLLTLLPCHPSGPSKEMRRCSVLLIPV